MANTPSIVILSDGTGLTALSLIKAIIPHLHDQLQIERFGDIQSCQQIQKIFDRITSQKVLVVFTFGQDLLKACTIEACQKRNFLYLDILGEPLRVMSQFLEQPVTLRPRPIRVVDERYYQRMQAIEFTLKHDDGQNPQDLPKADIIILGLSRTGKTPLSIYLSYHGFHVANVPIIHSVPLPMQLEHIPSERVFILTIHPQVLLSIRQNRITQWNHSLKQEWNYAQLEYIRQELAYVQKIIHQHPDWSVLDVSHKAIEETAFRIISILQQKGIIKNDPSLF